MPSARHQQLLLWLARKMTADGFVVTGFDGTAAQGGAWNDLPRPLCINRVRPDVWGMSRKDGQVAVGEAKTGMDLSNPHTRRQFRSFGRLVQKDRGMLTRFYVAVPRSAAYALDSLLNDVGLLASRHVFRMHVPDPLVDYDQI